MNTIQKGEFAQLIYSGEGVVRVEEEITLPDYCPDVVRLIRVDMTPVFEKNRTYIQDGVVNTELDGKAEYTVLYTDESGRCETYSFVGSLSSSFKKDVGKKTSVIPESIVSLTRPISTECSAKPMTARRMIVRGEVKVSCEVYANVLYSAYEPSADMGVNRVEADVLDMDVATCICSSEEEFMLSQDIKLPPTLPSCAKILSCSATLFVDSCKPTRDSVSVFITASFNVFYLSEESEEREGEYVSFYQPIEIRETLSSDDCAEDSICIARVGSGRAVCDIECDNFGENRILRLTLPYSVRCAVLENIETSVVRDVYGVGCVAEKTYSGESFMKYVGSLSETVPFRERVLLKASAQEVCGVKGNAWAKNTSISDGAGAVEAVVQIEGIRRENGSLSGAFREEFEMRLPLTLPDSVLSKISPANLSSDAVVTLAFADAQVVGDSLEISGELLIRAGLWEINSSKFVSDVSFSECEKRAPSTLFYYPTSGDTLWSVGSKYAVSKERLVEMNELEGTSLPTVIKIFDGN